MVQVVGPPTSAHGSEGAYCIPVRERGSENRAVLDSGAMQSLIRQSLVRPEALVMAPWVTIRCVHVDEHRYSIVSVEINLQGQMHNIKAAVSTRLSHPLISGTNWPGFQQVAKDLMGMRSRHLGSCEVCTAVSGGPTQTRVRPGSVGLPAESLRAPDFPPMEDFPLEQSRDDTLHFASDQVRSVDGHLVRPDVAPSHPFFSIIRSNVELRVLPMGPTAVQILW